jgi:hypothetical protein
LAAALHLHPRSRLFCPRCPGSNAGFFCLLDRTQNSPARRSTAGEIPFVPAGIVEAFPLPRARTRPGPQTGWGRQFLPLDEGRAEEAESLFQTHSSSGGRALPEDRLFERTWAETLVETALGRLEAAYKAEGKESLFDRLRTFLATGADPMPTYSELAATLAATESTIRSHVTRLRARYREMLRAEVRRTVDTESEVDEELRELLRVLIES